MHAIETTATFEGPAHLRLARPVADRVSGEVRVIVLFQETDEAAQGDFRSAIGSYYRDYPGEAPRNSGDWLRELREGEEG